MADREPPSNFDARTPPRRSRRTPPGTSPSWTFRRRLFVATWLFSAGTVAVIIRWRWESDSRLAETVVLAAFALMGSVVGFYSGFATWEDVKLNRRRGGSDESYPDDYP